MGGNLCLSAGGVLIAGVSGQNYFRTKNIVARSFYISSMILGSTASVAGGLAAWGNMFGLSTVAMGGDAFGGVCLYLGNRSQKAGRLAEGKTLPKKLNPFRLRKRSALKLGDKGMAFVTPGYSDLNISLSSIPYQEILILGSTVFIIYSYVKYIKFVIKTSRKIISKISPNVENSKLIRIQARFVINRFYYLQSVRKIPPVRRIYNFAVDE